MYHVSMAFRVQGTSEEDRALVDAVRELSRLEAIPGGFSGAVRLAFRYWLEEYSPPLDAGVEVVRVRTPRDGGAVEVSCVHRWERGSSGMVRCSKCGEQKK